MKNTGKYQKTKAKTRILTSIIIFIFTVLLIGCDAIGKKTLSGVYEPESNKGLLDRIEFFRDGTCIMKVAFIGETSSQYSITGNKIIIDSGIMGVYGNSTPYFEIKDSKTLLSLPVVMTLDGGQVWKKKK